MLQTGKGRGFGAQRELDLVRHQQMAGAILKICNQPLSSETEHVSTWRHDGSRETFFQVLVFG